MLLRHEPATIGNAILPGIGTDGFTPQVGGFAQRFAIQLLVVFLRFGLFLLRIHGDFSIYRRDCFGCTSAPNHAASDDQSLKKRFKFHECLPDAMSASVYRVLPWVQLPAMACVWWIGRMR